MKTRDIELRRTCEACPEQYDAVYNGETIGYLRLRYGVFTVDYPSVRGYTIYKAYTKGDGIFDIDERDRYLKIAKKLIKKEHLKNINR